MKLVDMTVTEFSNTVDSNSPAPGGGSVAALASNIGIGLARMMAHLSFGKKKYEGLEEEIKSNFHEKFDLIGVIKSELLDLVDKDTESFNEFMKALKMPKDTEEEIKERKIAMQKATIYSIEVPLKTANVSLEALENLEYLVNYGNKNAITDIGVGVLMIYTGIEGAVLNIKVNLSGLEDEDCSKNYLKSCNDILVKAKIIKNKLVENIHSQLDEQI